MPKKKKKKKKDLSSPAWMTTYGDMMTLLLCFFVLLYSFSVLDMERFKYVITAIKARLGVMEGGKTLTEGQAVEQGFDNNQLTDLALSRMEFARLREAITQYLEEKDLRDSVMVETSQRGLEIHFTSRVLFDLGKAELKPAAREVMEKIAGFLHQIDNQILVEGHTDDLPINNEEYPSNWELSTTRATTVVRFLIEQEGIAPFRMSAAGYSKYRPLVPNNSSQNRAKNRRVDVIILRTLESADVQAGTDTSTEETSPEQGPVINQ
ncbi:MAG: OmpA family protein [Halanaerobium sp.]|nr:OmpA family protein [Halanaerobium sp.]